MFVTTDETGRICCTGDVGSVEHGDVEFDFPEGFDFAAQSEYRIVDGGLVHDPMPESPEDEAARLKRELASTDYVPVKLAEMMITGEELPEGDADRYAGIILRRREIRARINEIEGVTEDGAHSQG